MKAFFVYFVVLLSFSLCSKDEEEPVYKESNEEFLGKQITEKLNKYLKQHNLENENTIDKKTFVEIFDIVTTGKVDEFIAPETKKLGNLGEEYAKNLPEKIPVSDLKKLLSFDEIMAFFLTTVKIEEYPNPKNEDPLNTNKDKVIPGSSKDKGDL